MLLWTQGLNIVIMQKFCNIIISKSTLNNKRLINVIVSIHWVSLHWIALDKSSVISTFNFDTSDFNNLRFSTLVFDYILVYCKMKKQSTLYIYPISNYIIFKLSKLVPWKVNWIFYIYK